MIYLAMLESEEEREVFRYIYEENYLKMYHIALSFLKQPTEAENAVHEAFLSLAENFQKYFQKCGREMTGLCVSIVKNKAIDSIRRAKHYSEADLNEIVLYEEEAENLEEAMEKSEESDRILNALRKVPEVYREALVLKYYYEFDNKEIAKIQGVSKKTVEMRLYRGKIKLREFMDEEGTALGR